VQTFLPYSDFFNTARILDRKRLGKQRVEAIQIMDALTKGTGWSHHPAVKMWEGHLGRLAIYTCCMIIEWMDRGYKDTLLPRATAYAFLADPASFADPIWMNIRAFHSSHRAALLAKDPAHYGQFGWQEAPKIEYWWPTKELS